MLIQRYARNPEVLIGLGQVCFAFGLLCLAVGCGATFTDSLPLGDFAAGFLVGLGSTLSGVSIVLNVRGLLASRRAGS